MIACASCSEQFYARPSEVVRGRKFCSLACHYEHRERVKADELGEGNKRCSRCSEIKPHSAFSPGSKKLKYSDSLAGWCKQCRSEDERVRRLNPQRRELHKARYEGDVSYRVRSLLNAMEKRARRASIPFDLDESWMIERFSAGVCELTGIPFDMAVDNSKPNIRTPSVDRIDSCGGYTKANCRVVLMGVNFALRDWGLDAFLPIARALIDRNER